MLLIYPDVTKYPAYCYRPIVIGNGISELISLAELRLISFGIQRQRISISNYKIYLVDKFNLSSIISKCSVNCSDRMY